MASHRQSSTTITTTSTTTTATSPVSSDDPYEQKLYQMFSSHDPGASGSLNAAALRRLCHTLDLKDREAVLVEACLRHSETRGGRVTFKGFKDGLLTLLGDGSAAAGGGADGGGAADEADDAVASRSGSDPAHSSANSSHRNHNSTKAAVSDGCSGDSAANSNNHNNHQSQDSPSREVSPKYVVAGKKYGRRSRPATNADMSSSSSDSEAASDVGDSDDEHCADPRLNASFGGTSAASQKVHRSSSHSELNASSSGSEPRKRRPQSGNAGKLKRCASLPAQPKPFQQAGKTRSSCGGFGDDSRMSGALNTSTTSTPTTAANKSTSMVRESSVESLGNLDFENLSHSLYDVWSDHGRTTNNYLNQQQLENVCAEVGLHGRIASKVAEEVFEKLGLCGANRADRVSFASFIALIQSDTDGGQQGGGASQAPDDGEDGADSGASTLLLSGGRPLRSPAAMDAMVAAHDYLSGIGGDSGLSTSKESADSLSEMLVGHAGDWPPESSAVPAAVIVDMWDTAGIPNPRSLLATLGFRSPEIRISQLSLAIEDDLQTMAEPEAADADIHSAATLLRASLALHKSEVSALQLAFRQLAAQNRKLHSNHREANRRAALMAAEVDERHAQLETTARRELQALEQRHAEALRDLTASAAADREQLTAYSDQLAQRNRALEAEDARLRVKAQMRNDECAALETEMIAIQRQCTELLEENIRLNNTIVEVDERQRADDSRKGDRESEELLELMEKVSALQLENATLRDRNDELVSEVEEKQVELTRARGKKGGGLAAELDAVGASATKRRGDSPSKTKLSEESPKLGKLRKCSDEGGATGGESQSDGGANSSGDWMALNAELSQSAEAAAAAAERRSVTAAAEGASPSGESVAELKARIAELQQRLQQATGTDQGQQIVELEAVVAEMSTEFEKMENYWQRKLSDERVLYEEDLRKSNAKFDELLKKMAEYEEQFVAGMEKASQSRLSPIEERDVLETQYVELEEELDELREQAQAAIADRDRQIEGLQERLKRAQHRAMEVTAEAEEAAETTSSTPISMAAAAAASAIAAIKPSAADGRPSLSLMDGNTSNEMPSLGGISCRSLEAESPASSPINYLWSQSTIQAPARDYQNPNWGKARQTAQPSAAALSTTETAATGNGQLGGACALVEDERPPQPQPIQRPNTPSHHSSGGSVHSGLGGGVAAGVGAGAAAELDKQRSEHGSDTSSVRSYGTPSVASTFNIGTPSLMADAGDRSAAHGSAEHPANSLQYRDELKRLKMLEMQLRHDIGELSEQRDQIANELQQLQEFRPAMERSMYARTQHPTLMQRNYALEQRIRALEQCLKNQQQYTETLMQQTCVQHNSVIAVLHTRIEEQQQLISEQAARLVNNDLFAKDMFVENSQLGDLLEQQRMCNTRLRQHHQQI